MDFNSFLNIITTSPYFSAINFLIAVGGIILAVIFYWRSTKNREPVFAIKSYNILADSSSKMTGLTVNYKTEIVNNLSITKIAFWNQGRETIKRNDIPEGDPLRISIKNGIKILDAEVISSNNPANKFQISSIDNDSSVRIFFDYLDKNQGGVIQIIHTGTTSNDLSIEGTVMGVGKPIKNDLDAIFSNKLSSFKISKPSRRLIRIIGLIFTTALSIFSIFLIIAAIISFSTFGLGMGIMYGLMTTYFYYTTVRRIVPRELSIFEEDFNLSQ